MVKDMEIRVIPISGRLTMRDGLRELWIPTEAFTPHQADGSMRHRYRFWRHPDGKYFAHTYIAFQHGYQVSAW